MSFAKPAGSSPSPNPASWSGAPLGAHLYHHPVGVSGLARPACRQADSHAVGGV